MAGGPKDNTLLRNMRIWPVLIIGGDQPGYVDQVRGICQLSGSGIDLHVELRASCIPRVPMTACRLEPS